MMREHVKEMLDSDLIRAVSHVVAKHGQDCLLVGAAAFEFSSAYLPRFTMDVDFAVTADSLEQLRTFEEDLNTSGIKKKNPPCSYLYKGGLKVDIIPFGAIAEGGIIKLPEMDRPLTVFGFDEALRTAREIKLECGLNLKVAILPAIFVLKTFAVYDRLRPDDLSDIRAILEHYQSNPDHELYYSKHQGDLHKYERIGAWLLGREVGLIIDAETYRNLARVWKEMLAEGSRYCQIFPRDTHLDSEDEESRFSEFIDSINIALEGIEETMATRL